MESHFDARRFFRYLGISLAVLLVIGVPVGLSGPTKPDTKGYESAVRTALTNADANEATAEGAPQQAVVNGWLARDLAEVQIKQSNAELLLHNDELVLLHLIAAVLIAALLAVIIAGGAAAVTRKSARSEPAQPSAASGDTQPEASLAGV